MATKQRVGNWVLAPEGWVYAIPKHTRDCAIWTSGHGKQPAPGIPAPWHSVPCDCGMVD